MRVPEVPHLRTSTESQAFVPNYTFPPMHFTFMRCGRLHARECTCYRTHGQHSRSSPWGHC